MATQLTTPAARLAALQHLCTVECDLAQSTYTTVNDRAADFVTRMFILGHVAEYFDSNTVRVDGLTLSRPDRFGLWSYVNQDQDRAIVLAARDAAACAKRHAAGQRITARDVATEAWSNEAGWPNAQAAVKRALRGLDAKASFLCECDCRVTFDDGSIVDLDLVDEGAAYDYPNSKADAELLEGWAVADADRAARALPATDHVQVKHLNDAVAAFIAIARIKEFADNAFTSLSAAIVSAQANKTQAFDAATLNATAQCALVSLEALASVTACCAKRSAGNG